MTYAPIPVTKAPIAKAPGLYMARPTAIKATGPTIQKIPGAWDPKGPGAPVFSNVALRGTVLDYRNV